MKILMELLSKISFLIYTVTTNYALPTGAKTVITVTDCANVVISQTKSCYLLPDETKW